MNDATLVVPRAAFAIEDPWAIPPGCRPVSLRRATDGTPPRLGCDAALYADDRCLNAIFRATDDRVVATHFRHDAPLYEEDVVELFIAPVALTTYFEIEVNPLGTTFDARIDSPDGVRTTMKADLGWTCVGLFAAVRRTPESLDVVMRFPFASLGAPAPARGDIWRANLFRIDRHPDRGDEFSAWCPTMRKPADFHVVAAFGRLQFS